MVSRHTIQAHRATHLQPMSRPRIRLLIPAVLAMLLFVLLVWPGLAYNFSNKFRLSTALRVVSAGPDIAAAGDYVAAVWSEGYNKDTTTKEFGRVYLKSAHAVSGWESRLQVFAVTANNWGKDPKVTFDPSDSSRVHIVWAQADSCSGGGNPLPCKWRTIKYTTCTLIGVDSCASPEIVYRTTGTNHDYSTPDVAVDTSGNVYVVWRRSSPAPAALMYRRKPSGGSFSGGGAITGTDGGRNPALAFVDGRLHLVWDAGNTIKYQRNSALGNTWSSDQSVTWNAPVGYQDPSFPAIGAGSSSALYAVWAIQSASNNQQYALAFDFSQNGATWKDAGGDGLGVPDKGTFTLFKSSKGGSVSYLESLKPDVAVTGTGTAAYAHVVWHGAQGEGSIYNVWYTSLAGIDASNWSSILNVSSSSNDSGDPAIAVGSGLDETHVAFMEDADASNADVWYMGANGNRENDGNKDEGEIFLPVIFKNS
jgi:hypothetical protein